MALTDKQIEGVIAAQKDIDAIMEKLPQGGKPDQKVIAQLEAVAKKNGFASYGEYANIVANRIAAVLKELIADDRARHIDDIVDIECVIPVDIPIGLALSKQPDMSRSGPPLLRGCIALETCRNRVSSPAGPRLTARTSPIVCHCLSLQRIKACRLAVPRRQTFSPAAALGMFQHPRAWECR